MLTLQKTKKTFEVISLPVDEGPIDEKLNKEWLLTNERGGFSSSTIIGCNTRRYHGLLVGSMNPPVNRILGLSNCLEMVVRDGEVFNLSTFEFNGKFAPKGYGLIRRFRRDIGAHFDYELDDMRLTKSVYLQRDADTVAIVYNFKDLTKPIEFVVRPFVGLRDFHALQRSYAHLVCDSCKDGLLIRHNTPNSCQLYLSSPFTQFEKDPQWWFEFVYRKESQRGQDYCEDLWTPGFFKCRLRKPGRLVLWASLSKTIEPDKMQFDLDSMQQQLRDHQNKITAGIKTRDKVVKTLSLAADQFVTKRWTGENYRTTLLAGFPWFSDWGRDAFISLPGLLLQTKRFEEAKSVLTTFAAAADAGIIPNRFDDRSNTAHFNSVDASLWFIDAAFQYLKASEDSTTFSQHLLPMIRWIVDSFQKGTLFQIYADEDGLIRAGNENTQLTWMDAKCDGIAFTPRHGKAVEINALWYNALCRLAEYYTTRNPDNANLYKSMAEKVEKSFREKFWNESEGYLNDCILPDGAADTSLRPNQVFAVSLEHSPLTLDQQKKVVEAVQKNLLTPYGLQTLNSSNDRYIGRYSGPQRQRDQAYHQGTVWPFLIGPFIQAYLKVNDHSKESKKNADLILEPLIEHITEIGCLGSISEIFDGDNPQKQRGCIAQAWSVAEVLRAYMLIHS